MAREIDALVIMDQVDAAGTGVLTEGLLQVVGGIARQRPHLPILADSRRGLQGYPAVCWKMNRAELGKLRGTVAAGWPWSDEARRPWKLPGGTAARCSSRWPKRACSPPWPDGQAVHVPALPLRGPIDIVERATP